MPPRHKGPKKIDKFCWARDFRPEKRAQFGTYELADPKNTFVATSGNRIVGIARFSIVNGKHVLTGISMMPEFRGHQSRDLLIKAVKARFDDHPEIGAVYGISAKILSAGGREKLSRWFEMCGADPISHRHFTHRITRSKFFARYPPK